MPAPSTATPAVSSAALVAGPPSPEEPCKVPPPATLVMIPLVETLRMWLLPRSAMNRLPAPSTATPSGQFSCALVAGPPLPEKPGVPLPATVAMMPLGKTLRMRLLPVSAINRLPVLSTATAAGPGKQHTRSCNRALVAGPPSPE